MPNLALVQESKRGLAGSAVFIARNRFATLDKTLGYVQIRNLQNEITKRCTLPCPGTDAIFYAGTGMLLCRSEDKASAHRLRANSTFPSGTPCRQRSLLPGCNPPTPLHDAYSYAPRKDVPCSVSGMRELALFLQAHGCLFTSLYTMRAMRCICSQCLRLHSHVP